MAGAALTACILVLELIRRWDKAPGNARAFQSDGKAAADVTGGGRGDMEIGEAEGQEGAASQAAGGFSFRGDSRWLGVSKARDGDLLAGFGASGNLVYADLS
jgi:hypothetical protein